MEEHNEHLVRRDIFEKPLDCGGEDHVSALLADQDLSKNRSIFVDAGFNEEQIQMDSTLGQSSQTKDTQTSTDDIGPKCEINEIPLSTGDEEKKMLTKRKRRIPVILTSLGQTKLPGMDKRRLSLQLPSQSDKEVDQCLRRLSNVDLSCSPHQEGLPGEARSCVQQNEVLASGQLHLLPKPPESKPFRSHSASRIPIQRSRSTPPPTERPSAQLNLTPQDTIPENEFRSSKQRPEDWITRRGQSCRLERSCREERQTVLSQGERGRTGPRGKAPDKRRASTAGMASLYAGHPRARRSLSFSAGCRDLTYRSALSKDRTTTGANTRGSQDRTGSKEMIITGGSRGKDGTGSTGTPADGLRNLNFELRDQVTRLRAQLDAQKGSIRQVQWQKVLDVRQARQQEQQRLWTALEDLRQKLGQEKTKEVEQMREHLTAKAESDLQKLTRHKDAEIFKLKQELVSKESMLKRVLNDERKARLGLTSDSHKTKLLDELKALRQEKKVLEESLHSASSAQRAFSDGLRKHSERRESEVSKVKRDMQVEVKGLVSNLMDK
ncbi:Janus kinase and microtubule-interacting protein 1 [Elysia marginata]|uniref:Janus kinase and microtubule-interacting protein 1 n=1 Tax=Elysia marginata TaxID=1093978 RepID=A0AAV4I6V5_9GAST|nr:Janus kinase and microtubule-interacting protein 1 [Elysia marginata]